MLDVFLSYTVRLGVIMLQIKDISKEYKTESLVQKALDHVSLNLRDNEFVAILGPSGSGKTTLLNIVGGLDRYDSGDLVIHGISTQNYEDRDWDSYRNHTIGFVFQSYNLIPHQTILSNVELALTISGKSKSERREKAEKALEQVGLKEQCHKKPSQLSGGQMQRVAIARALVNDPDILLADEPTGALDSATSLQVMNLLKEVAKDRLVVMVTHNPELAKEYATRIVNLKDGKICSDSNPYIVEEAKTTSCRNMGKTSMSWLTSLSLSFNNLKTKKGRTILTAFAGSIGIIGIALILSLSNGVSQYIKSIEEDTLSEYPLQIQASGFDMMSMMGDMHSNIQEEKEGDIQAIDMLTNMFSTIGSNDLASLKRYIESGKSNLEEYTSAIEYSYNIIPEIYKVDDGIRKVNPDQTFAPLGFGSSASMNSMMSSMMSTDVFMELPKNESLYKHQYELKAGAWPKDSSEAVLVLTSKGYVSDFMLYALGLRDYEELDKMVEQFVKEEEIHIPENKDSYHYEDILGMSYKVIPANQTYVMDEEFNVWKDKSDDKEFMKNLVEKGKDLTITGIVQPKENTDIAMLPSGVYYTSELVNELMQDASSSDIVKAQLEHPSVNVFSGKEFTDTEETSNFDMSSLFTINEEKMKAAFQVDESKLVIDFQDLNKKMSNVQLPEMDISSMIQQLDFNLTSEQLQEFSNQFVQGYLNYVGTHPEADVRKVAQQFQNYLKTNRASEIVRGEIERIIQENGEIKITLEQMNEIMMKVMDDYMLYAKENHLVDITKLDKYFMAYLNSAEAKKALDEGVRNLISSTGIEQQFKKMMSEMMMETTQTITGVVETELENSMNKFTDSMKEVFHIDQEMFVAAFETKMTKQDLAELMTAMVSKQKSSYEGNLKKLGYADVNKPSEIALYPKDFESKEEVINILEAYNADAEEKGNEDQVITYTDMVGTLMSSVTNIIQVISYVLVAFVAISLVVSSIMIGVITYISVLERKKEIGILRAIGASKRNISEVFNAETFIIGLFAGLIGIGVTLLLLIPSNYIIHSIAGNTSMNASLPLTAGIVLIGLSVILTLIGGIIPSRKAAKEDPVTALRSE